MCFSQKTVLARNRNSKEGERNSVGKCGVLHIIERKTHQLGNNNNKHILSTYYMSASI